MKKTHYSTTAKKLNEISILADHANNCGNIDKNQHKCLKKKIKGAQLDNVFAAMAAYCTK